MDKEKQYEKMYRAMLEYEDRAHLRNMHRIRVGIGCLVFVPIAFLVLMFLTDSSKPLFLMLWIISLYGIATFLILVEYADHKLQKRLAQFRGEENVEMKALIGQHMENVEETLKTVKEKAEHFLISSTDDEEEMLDLDKEVPDIDSEVPDLDKEVPDIDSEVPDLDREVPDMEPDKENDEEHS